MDIDIPYYSDKVEGADTILNKIRRVLTSTLLFIPAFILSNFLLQFLIGLISGWLKYTVKTSYNRVLILPADYKYWSHINITLVYFLPPVICFLIGAFFFNFLRINTDWFPKGRIFLFWLSVTMVNLALTHAFICPLGTPENLENGLYQTFSVVAAWFWLNRGMMVIFSIVALILSIVTGLILRDEIMRYSFSKKLVSTGDGMNSFASQMYVIPVLLGAAPLFILCAKESIITAVMQIVNLLIISVGIFLMNSIRRTMVRCNREDVLNHLPVYELGIGLSVWAVIFLFFR